MSSLSRRHLLKRLGTLGAAGLVVHPSELLKLYPEQGQHFALGDSDMVRLSSNENPYSPSPLMAKTLADLGPDLCRYPNMHFSDLEAKIAMREGVPADQVVVCSGSREGLNVVGLHASLKGGEIATCLPTYNALLSYAEQFGAMINASPLDENLGFNLEAIKASINEKTKLVFICNPNNPTGTLLDAAKLEAFCKEVSRTVPVFVDEVYKDYIVDPDYPSMKLLISQGYDIIIARTFSKVYGLAGARIGYLITNAERAKVLRRALMSGSNVLGLKMALTALQDDSFYRYSLAKNHEAKEMIYSSLDKVGLKYIRSHTNFVFFKTDIHIEQLSKTFASHGVEVGRPFPPFYDWCRISTGTIDEVGQFTKVLERVFA